MKALNIFVPGISSKSCILLLFLLLIKWNPAHGQSGNGIYDAIPLAVNSCSGGSLTDYQTTYYFSNTYGNSGPDVWYSFNLSSTSDVLISLCGSDFDTYLWLLDSNGNQISYDDDGGCSGNTSQVYQPSLPAGTYYIVAEGYSNASGNLAMELTVNGGGIPPLGSNMYNFINAGSFSSSGSYTDTRNNSDNCLGNDIGQPSNDIYYRFSVNGTATVTLSHCGSGFDTYIHLLDAAGNVITYNDDTSMGACPGNQAYIQYTLAAGTYYVVSEGYNNNTGNIVTTIGVAMGGGGPPVISYASNGSILKVGALVTLMPTNTGGAVTSGEPTTSTFAGASQGYADGIGSSARFNLPTNVTVDAAGNMYIADTGNKRIRKITPSGTVSTYAGNGTNGFVNGTLGSASFTHPTGMVFDAAGNLYVSDQYNHAIRKISSSWVVSTFAGTGSEGSADGTGTGASFSNPSGLACDALGNIYVADYGNYKIRKITPSGVVTTFAGTGVQGATNGPGTSATFRSPMGLAFDGLGNLYVADRLNYIVRKITPSGVVSTFAGNGTQGSVNGPGSVASFDRPDGIAINGSGDLYITDENNHLIRKISAAGVVSTLAGLVQVPGTVNGTGAVVRFNTPYGIGIDGQGNLYIAEILSHTVRKIVMANGYTISPALPPGLFFDGTTGVISGRPTTTTPWITYTVTASNSFGTGSTMFNLQVIFDPYANMNFIHSKSYDDDGVLINESKNFYNNDGKPIQSQVKNISANQVLASEVLYDALGRSAGSTLAAPINSSELNFKDKFVTNENGLKYDYTNFDLTKTNTPDPVNNSSPGTLGWYYSNNNTLEPYVPATAYPYTRNTFFNDGTGSYKKSANVGEVLKMGSGHQSSENTLGVVNELDFYTQLRNKFFSESVVGSGNSLKANGMLHVVQDENGIQAANITDLEGRVLMTAKAGASSGLVVSNSVEISNQAGYQYFIDWSNGGVSPLFTPYINVNGGNIEIFKSNDNWASSTSVYSGAAIDYFSLTATQGKYRITSLTPFNVSYQVPANNGTEVSRCQNCDAKLGSEGKDQIHYFRLYANTTISVTGTGWKLYNMSEDELEINTSESPITLDKGYYKISIPESGTASISYSNIYSNISCNFYNQLGQLLGSIAPEGVKAILNNGLSNYATLNNVPFVNTYEYDSRGRIIANIKTDAGRTEFIYRNDGSIRFSQNSLQRSVTPAKFAYVNYDRWGRSIESGEFVETGTITFAAAKTDVILQESLALGGGLTGGTKPDWVKVHYDDSDNSHGVLGYIQNESSLRASVSWTENASGYKTWYNYDDDGRISWTVKHIPGLGSKTVDYTYDAKGNTSKVDYQKNVAGEQFVHEYDYDADNRASVVYTSTATSGRKEQARYFYYLHGPLKRIQLAENLQGIDYIYTPQGTLKSINHPSSTVNPNGDGASNSMAPDVFGMTLEYFNGDYIRNNTGITSLNTGGIPSYNGNIMAQSWRSQKPQAVIANYGGSVNNPAMVTYDYDDKYQFDNNKYGMPNFSGNSFTESVNANREYGLSYDANGNIGSMSRTNAIGSNIANYSYNYQPNTNKLSSVSNYAIYSYDNLGQMSGQVRNDGQGFYVDYDLNGKITAIYSNAEKTNLRVSFGYDESGNRVRKTDHLQNVVTYYLNDGSGNLLAMYDNRGTSMQQKEIPVYAISRLGVYNRMSNSYQYELTDHLGNVRAVINGIKQSNGQADVVYYSDYYPYGTPLTLSNNDYRFGYQGQYAEVDKETGWNNFDLRMYDPAIGRWMSTDPHGQYDSPYVGMGNDPVSSIDPDGGYSWLGAKYRQIGAFFSGKDPSAIYRSGDEYGFNITSSVEGSQNRVATFGTSKTGHDSNDWFSNFSTASDLVRKWATGTGDDVAVYNNDRVAKSFQNSSVANQAREFWYKQVNSGKKTIYDGVTNFRGEQAWTGGNFGVSGIIKANIDPLEQFVGSFTPQIESDGITLKFSIKNTTSLKSLLYGLAPDYQRSAWGSNLSLPGGNMEQIYVFYEPIRFDRITRFR